MYATVKLLNFRMPENVAVIYLILKKRGQNGTKEIANSEDTDRTAHLGAVWFWPVLIALAYLSENLGSLRYILKYLQVWKWHFSDMILWYLISAWNVRKM